MLREKGRFLEPKSPSGQNARLRAGIEKATEGVTLVSTRHSPPQFPSHPYSIMHALDHGAGGSRDEKPEEAERWIEGLGRVETA
jgi:hypothetical protein